MECRHGCGPVHCGPMPQGWYSPVGKHDWYEDVNWPLRRRARDMRAASLDGTLDKLREELRRAEAALADLGRQA